MTQQTFRNNYNTPINNKSLRVFITVIRLICMCLHLPDAKIIYVYINNYLISPELRLNIIILTSYLCLIVRIKVFALV